MSAEAVCAKLPPKRMPSLRPGVLRTLDAGPCRIATHPEIINSSMPRTCYGVWVHLPQITFEGRTWSLHHFVAYTGTAERLGFTAVCANDHLLFSRPWLGGPMLLAARGEWSVEGVMHGSLCNGSGNARQRNQSKLFSVSRRTYGRYTGSAFSPSPCRDMA